MRVGVFGGTFDPPHVGHLIVAQDAMEVLGLDRVRFVPAHVSPLKTDRPAGTPADLRLEMVRLAVARHPGFEVSEAEVERDPPSFTVDTLRDFAEAQPEVEWTLLMGADQWADFDRWREPATIAALARIVVLTRAGTGARRARVPVDQRMLEVPRVDVSASDIRRRARAGRSIRYLVPEPVRALIDEKGLYAKC